MRGWRTQHRSGGHASADGVGRRPPRLRVLRQRLPLSVCIICIACVVERPFFFLLCLRLSAATVATVATDLFFLRLRGASRPLVLLFRLAPPPAAMGTRREVLASPHPAAWVEGSLRRHCRRFVLGGVLRPRTNEQHVVAPGQHSKNCVPQVPHRGCQECRIGRHIPRQRTGWASVASAVTILSKHQARTVHTE